MSTTKPVYAFFVCLLIFTVRTTQKLYYSVGSEG